MIMEILFHGHGEKVGLRKIDTTSFLLNGESRWNNFKKKGKGKANWGTTAEFQSKFNVKEKQSSRK